MDAEMMAQLSSWGPIVILVLFFYFLLYRPQKQAQKKREEMLSRLKVGRRCGHYARRNSWQDYGD